MARNNPLKPVSDSHCKHHDQNTSEIVLGSATSTLLNLANTPSFLRTANAPNPLIPRPSRCSSSNDAGSAAPTSAGSAPPLPDGHTTTCSLRTRNAAATALTVA